MLPQIGEFVLQKAVALISLFASGYGRKMLCKYCNIHRPLGFSYPFILLALSFTPDSPLLAFLRERKREREHKKNSNKKTGWNVLCGGWLRVWKENNYSQKHTHTNTHTSPNTLCRRETAFCVNGVPQRGFLRKAKTFRFLAVSFRAFLNAFSRSPLRVAVRFRPDFPIISSLV